MCSINHDLKCIFIHIPKTAGTFIRDNLEKYHNFKFYIIKRPDHELICKKNINNNRYNLTGSKDFGIYSYAKTSNYINRLTGMDKNKWLEYSIFCFVRNPYDRVVSAWNYLTKKHNLDIPFDKYIEMDEEVSDFEYIHVFMPQYYNIIDEFNNIKAKYVGKFENLYEDFKNILKKIGCNENFDIEKKNNFEHDKIIKYIKNQKILDKINKLFKLDFEYFGYKLIENFNEFYYKNTGKQLLNNNFYSTYEIYPKLKIFEDNFDEIKLELLLNLDLMHTGFLGWENKSLDKEENKRSLIPIYGFGNWSIYHKKFPIICNLVKQIDDIQVVIFIKLSAKTRIPQHYGYNPSSNFILRSHLGLIVPESCGILVDDEIQIHQEKKWITFDDSKLHFAWNNSNSDRYVLLIDLVRPDFVAAGNSQREPDEKILFEYIDLFKSNI